MLQFDELGNLGFQVQ